MARRPHNATGVLRSSQGRWLIELEPTTSSLATRTVEVEDPFSDGTPVRLLFWTNDPTGGPTELEAIAEIQQLDLSVVAHGLGAEGALASERQDFMERLSLIEQ